MTDRGWLDHASSAALAVLLAVMLWFVASEDITPIEDVEPFPPGAALPVEFRNVPAGSAVFEPSVREVQVRLRGLETGLEEMRPEDVRAYLDLEGVATDAVTHTAELAWDCPTCVRRGVRVSDADVGEVAVRLGPEVSETRAVTVQLLDSPPSGFVVTGTPTEPGQVALTGARAQVDRVVRVVAEVTGLEDVRLNSRFEAVPGVPVDADGEPVPDVTVKPDAVAVDVSVRRRGIAVSVSPSFEGVEADGYYVSGITVQPQLVELAGDADQLGEIGRRGTVTAIVDITDASDDVEQIVPLELPAGVSAVNAPDGVTVTIRIASLPDTVRLQTPVRTRGLEPGLVARSVSPDQVEVLVRGPQATLGDLTGDDVRVWADLTGLGPGSHTVTLSQPIVPAGYFVRSVNPSFVEVVIEEREDG